MAGPDSSAIPAALIVAGGAFLGAFVGNATSGLIARLTQRERIKAEQLAASWLDIFQNPLRSFALLRFRLSDRRSGSRFLAAAHLQPRQSASRRRRSAAIAVGAEASCRRHPRALSAVGRQKHTGGGLFAPDFAPTGPRCDCGGRPRRERNRWRVNSAWVRENCRSIYKRGGDAVCY